jgi:hypothetical protein
MTLRLFTELRQICIKTKNQGCNQLRWVTKASGKQALRIFECL